MTTSATISYESEVLAIETDEKEVYVSLRDGSIYYFSFE
jgi:hypothetical protein